MKILFIQLPLVDHSMSYIQGNIEYGPASLSGFISSRFSSQIRVDVLPFVISGFCSDRIIVQYVLNCDYDLVCFSSYLWNIERNLKISKMIKNKSTGIKIFFGGPEIIHGSHAFSKKREAVDLFFAGEGEWFFSRYLQGDDMELYSVNLNDNKLVVQPSDQLVAPDEIYEPLTGRRLNSMIDGSVFLELTRGCPYRCSYCYYSKNCNTVRELPFDYLVEAITKGSELSEIYILSPTFNKTSGFREKLKILKKVNSDISLHTEMRADGIDNKTARLMYEAGFRSIEVGLQSLNKNALESVGRRGDVEKELQGMLAMKKAGIDLKIGIIPGLPGDDPESFLKTVDRLISLGFSENIELYPLMVLPGTGIRDRAVREKIQFQDKPPYFYTGGWGISFDDIINTEFYIENKTGYSQSVDYLPDFNQKEGGIFCRGVSFNGNEAGLWNPSLYYSCIETSVFTFFVKVTEPSAASAGLEAMITQYTGSELINLILFTDLILDEKKTVELLETTESDNFYRRLNIFSNWREGCIFRIFQVIENTQIFLRCESDYLFFEPVLLLNRKNAFLLDENSGDPFRLLVQEGEYSYLKQILVNIYLDDPEMISFENEQEQKQFFTDTGTEHVDYPFSFRVIPR